ncbi:unnamed protein product [Cuscuta campestris]|uniref:Uncharacterized protein n=1 Tax=Cuscuta campestris TaxID=132261 RepID=A0A484MW57_9ASTE|nr:unnamed protein product [Cuscuta campestris]
MHPPVRSAGILCGFLLVIIGFRHEGSWSMVVVSFAASISSAPLRLVTADFDCLFLHKLAHTGVGVELLFAVVGPFVVALLVAAVFFDAVLVVFVAVAVVAFVGFPGDEVVAVVVDSGDMVVVGGGHAWAGPHHLHA